MWDTYFCMGAYNTGGSRPGQARVNCLGKILVNCGHCLQRLVAASCLGNLAALKLPNMGDVGCCNQNRCLGCLFYVGAYYLNLVFG